MAAVDEALAALVGTVSETEVGEHLGAVAEDERVVTHFFAATDPGYVGWRWAVTITRAYRQKTVTLNEVVMLPGESALQPPEWVPWKDRMAPGDLGPGDLVPVTEDDLRLVPERREELTTEGGLDVVRYFDTIKAACARCAEAGIRVSLFIDPDAKQIDAARRTGAPVVELHTGKYADADSVPGHDHELQRIRSAAEHAHAQGLQVNAGHGLNYHNVQPIVAIPHLVELNIGHAIIAESLFIGLEAAVKKMKALLSGQQ
jgi:hypothetical protein